MLNNLYCYNGRGKQIWADLAVTDDKIQLLILRRLYPELWSNRAAPVYITVDRNRRTWRITRNGKGGYNRNEVVTE